jgi:tight adherence protein B
MSGYILAALPPGLAVFMYFANREYVSLLWTTLFGWIMLGAAVFLLALGSWSMAKLAKVEV